VLSSNASTHLCEHLKNLDRVPYNVYAIFLKIPFVSLTGVLGEKQTHSTKDSLKLVEEILDNEILAFAMNENSGPCTWMGTRATLTCHQGEFAILILQGSDH
jgi:hypothetical protein